MDPKEIDGRLMALQGQRDEAMNRIVVLSGKMILLNARVKELEEQLGKTDDDRQAAQE